MLSSRFPTCWPALLAIGLFLFYFCFFGETVTTGEILKSSISNIGKVEIQWTTLINSGYVKYAKNFLFARKSLNLNFGIMIWCSEAETVHLMQSLNLCVPPVHCLLLPELSQAPLLPSELQEFGHEGYKRVMFAKLDAIVATKNYLAALGRFPWLGFLDMDVALFRDPTDVFATYAENHPNFSVFTQCDEGTVNVPCSEPESCPNMNAGVMILRNSPKILQILSHADADLKLFHTDQDYLRATLDLGGIRRFSLPRDILSNGAYIGIHEHPYEEARTLFHDLQNVNTSLLHFNWLVGDQKMVAMKVFGEWKD